MSEVYFCHNCGRGLIEGAKFCPYCGTSINEETDAVESGAIFERYDKDEQDIENLAKWEGNVPQSISCKTRFRCLVCGYVHEGEAAPNGCPICGATTDKFMVDGAKVKAHFINCFNCMAYIPGDSKFCPVCRTELYSTCPKCGHNYSAQYLNCPQCGTNREEYLSQIIALKEEENRQKLRQSEALKQAALEKERLENEMRREEQQRLEKLRKEQLVWLDCYVRDNRQEIVQRIESTVSENESVIEGRQNMKTLSVILFVLAGLSFILFPCFSGTEHQGTAIIGFFVVFPFLTILAIILYHSSQKADLKDVRDDIRQMIENKYGGQIHLGWPFILSILRKHEISLPPES